MSCDSTCVPEGPRGLSAYQIWLAEGNTGTEQDFLDSLVGPAGTPGPTGAPGAPGVCECEIVHYAEQRAPVLGLEGLYPVLLDTSYTVATNGIYRVLYTGHADFMSGTGTITLDLRINNASLPDVRRLLTVGQVETVISDVTYYGQPSVMMSFNLFASQINLTAGQVITINGNTTSINLAIRNCVIEISKIG
jgi:hypothetical protein